MTEYRKLKVFLCHSKDDRPKVRELYRRLIADGFDAWLDEEKLMPGQDWDLEIRKAVREADVVVVCLSNGSVTKAGYVQKEIRFALDVADEQPEGAIFIIPARLEDCQVPSRLDRWQWVNLFEENGHNKLNNSLNLRANTLGIPVHATIFKEIRGLPYEPVMMAIAAGKFLMGTTKEQAQQIINEGGEGWEKWVEWEQPQHTVEMPEYCIGKYPITNREYQVFIRSAEYNPPHGWFSVNFPPDEGGHPVVNVSWEDATAYCKWLSKKCGKQYHLPTEAEWEKAARWCCPVQDFPNRLSMVDSKADGESLIYPWGNNFDSKKANTREANLNDTLDVGNLSPQGDSPHGCSGMAGNIWEWCGDWFKENEYKQRESIIVKDPRGPKHGLYRVLRGGSFHDNHMYARCAYRGKFIPDFSRNNWGFRAALSLSKD